MASVVLAGRASPGLGSRLADALGCDLAAAEIRDFPDGETYVRLTSDVAGKEVVAVQATRSNHDFVELLLLQDAAHEAGATKVTAVLPYYGYARQDQVFKPGEAVSARAIARALYATANEMYIVDPHKMHILDFFPGVSHGVSAVPQLCERLRDWGVDCILAPDKGARPRAEAAAGIMGVPFDHLQKTRLSATEVRMEPKDLDVSGKTVAIVDDMIASGGTMAVAAGQLREQGAANVYAACTHGIFTTDAVARLRQAGIDRVLCTDTVEDATGEAPDGCDIVSAAPAIAAAMRRAVLA